MNTMDFYAQQTSQMASPSNAQRHPFDMGLGYLVTYHDIQKNQTRSEVEYLNTKEEHDEHRYIVEWYVNGEKTFSVMSVRANAVFDLAVPGDAMLPHASNRWHVLMRHAALERMQQLGQDEKMILAFQDPHVNPEYDTEKIVVYRDNFPQLWYE